MINMTRRDSSARKLLRKLAVVGVVAGMLAGGVAAAAPASAQTTNPCAFAVFIGVRGTDAPAGSGKSAGGNGWTSGGFGDVVNQLASKYKSATHPWQAYVVSLNYNASLVDNNPVNIATAAQKLANEVNWYANNCTYGPAVIIAGHSQGAGVVTNMLNNAGSLLTTKARTMVRAVALFGNPGFWAGRNWNASSSPKTGGGLYTIGTSAASQNAVTANVNKFFFGRVQDYCRAKDWVCQAGSAVNNTIHGAYSGVETTTAYNWIASKLTSTARSTGPTDWGDPALSDEQPGVELHLFPEPGDGYFTNPLDLTVENSDVLSSTAWQLPSKIGEAARAAESE